MSTVRRSMIAAVAIAAQDIHAAVVDPIDRGIAPAGVHEFAQALGQIVTVVHPDPRSAITQKVQVELPLVALGRS